MESTQLLPLFDNTTNKPQYENKTLPHNASLSNQDSTETLLNSLFPDQKREDKTIKQARAILGNLTEKFSMDELQQIIILFQYLSESWLDMYERELFDGKTLQELLNLG